MRHKYYIVTVGDDPGDEQRTGPYTSFKDAVSNVDGYHGSGHVSQYQDMICLNRQISSAFVIWHCSDTPEYFGEIMTRLKEGLRHCAGNLD